MSQIRYEDIKIIIIIFEDIKAATGPTAALKTTERPNQTTHWCLRERFTAQHPQHSALIPSLFHPHRVFISLICFHILHSSHSAVRKHPSYFDFLYGVIVSFHFISAQTESDSRCVDAGKPGLTLQTISEDVSLQTENLNVWSFYLICRTSIYCWECIKKWRKIEPETCLKKRLWLV